MHCGDLNSRTRLDSLAPSRVLVKLMFCLLPMLCPASLRAQDTSNEFWPEVDVFLKLNNKSRLFFLYSATKLDDRQTYSDGSLGAHLDVYAVPLLGRRVALRNRADIARSK